MTVRALIPPRRGGGPVSPDDPDLGRLHERIGAIEHIVAELSARQLPTLALKLDGVLDLLARRRRDRYTVGEVAEMTARSEYTVRRWIAEGRLTAVRLAEGGPRGRLLISRDELDRLIRAGQGASIPEIALD